LFSSTTLLPNGAAFFHPLPSVWREPKHSQRGDPDLAVQRK
jgi:hypothetical protein